MLVAPADGIVLTRAAERGAILGAGATIYTLSLTRPVWVRAYCAEPELGEVSPGRAVLVYTDGRRDRPYHGQVGFVSPTSEFTPKNVETADLRTALVGKLDPAHQGIDATLRLQIHERAGGRLELIPGKYIIGETGREKVQPIYGHLQGTWDEWMLRAVPNYKVPAQVKSQLQKALAEK